MRLTWTLFVATVAGCFSPSSGDGESAGSSGNTASDGSSDAGMVSSSSEGGNADTTVGVEGSGTDGTAGGSTSTGTDGSTGDSTGTGEETTGSSGTTAGADTTKRVFVSAMTMNGASVATADDQCQTYATSAGLGGDWVSWTSGNGTHAIDKLDPDAGPYVLVDAAATLIAMDNADLTDGTIASPINIVETGVPYVQFTAVWTGTNADGMASGTNCVDWTVGDNSENGTRGNVTITGQNWTQIANNACSGIGRIYCFER